MKFPFRKKREEEYTRVIKVRVLMPKAPSSRAIVKATPKEIIPKEIVPKESTPKEAAPIPAPAITKLVQPPSPTSIRELIQPHSPTGVRHFVFAHPMTDKKDIEEEKEIEDETKLVRPADWAISYNRVACNRSLDDTSSEGDASEDSDDVKGYREVMKIVSMYMEDFREKYGIECPSFEDLMEHYERNYSQDCDSEGISEMGEGVTTSTQSNKDDMVQLIGKRENQTLFEPKQENPLTCVWNDDRNFDSIYEQSMVACGDLNVCSDSYEQHKDVVITVRLPSGQ